MGDWCLPIFPLDTNAITVSTTVWIGVLLCVAFNLRLGWTLSGLVVPGYLVPLLITRPASAGVIIAEAVITYFLAVMISELPRKLSYWSSFFGRDRFFVILILSVVVRTVFDGFLFQFIGEFFVREFDVNAVYQDDLHSFGLIVVALIANYFWKPGVLRGLPPVLVCVVLTYAVVQFVFVPFTNFDIGTIHSMYEDITTSLLSSPKSYIILIITAYLASLVNLRYAWDFNGILIPALLGLLWHDPSKIAISAVECLLIWCIGSLLLKTPIFRRMAIQGASKVAFFFTVCYLYRLLACHLVPKIMPDVQVSDLFGFGYLLTTLMAIKIHDKKHSLRMLRGTAEISLVGAVAGSLIGFIFYLSSGANVEANQHLPNVGSVAVIEEPTSKLLEPNESINQLVMHDKVLIYEKQLLGEYRKPSKSQMMAFANCLAMLSSVDPKNNEQLAAASEGFEKCNYGLSFVDNRYFYLRERSPAHGFGIYVIDTQRRNGIAVEIPAPLNESGTIEAGLVLLQKMPVSTLAIAGAPRWIDSGDVPDVTRTQQSMFRVFHDLFASRNALQIRGYTRESVKEISRSEQTPIGDVGSIANETRVYVKGSLPDELNLSSLKELIGEFHVRWGQSPFRSSLSKSTTDSFVEIVLPADQCHQLRVKLATEFGFSDDVLATDTSFSEWIAKVKTQIATQGSDGYRPAKIQQLLYIDREVISPLLHVLGDANSVLRPREYWSSDSFRERLIPINESARVLGYRLSVIDDIEYDDVFITLSEVESERSKGWGTYVFRPGLKSSYAVEVTRPLFERSSFEFGINLFCQPKSSVLLIAGAHPRANEDGSADISSAANRTNLFNLVRHVLLRNVADRPFLIVQARSIYAPVSADVVIATDDGTTNLEQLTPLKSFLVRHLQKDLSVDFVKGQVDAAGYELSILMQAMAVQISQNKEVISLWLSPSIRTQFRDQSTNTTLQNKFDACEIPSIKHGLVGYLTQRYPASDIALSSWRMPKELRERINAFVRTSDIVQLQAIKKRFPDWQFLKVLDGSAGHSYLLCSRSPSNFPAIVNLTGAVNSGTQLIREASPAAIRCFVRTRTLWLEPDVTETDIDQSEAVQ